MFKDVYIAGVGLVHPLGHIASLQDIFVGRTANTEEHKLSLKELLPGAKLRRVPRAALMGLEAAALALQDAGLATRFSDEAASGTGIFTGSAHCCVEASFSFMDSIIDFGAKLSSPTAFSLSVNNVFTGLLSLHLNAQGPSYTSCQFGASFAGALAAAYSSLISGGCKFALVGAVEEQAEHLSKLYELGLKRDAVKKYGWEFPSSDCAVFFVLSTEPAACAVKMHAPIWQINNKPSADVCFSVLDISEKYNSHIINCLSLYGCGPAMQACDLALSYLALRDGLNPAPKWFVGEVFNGPAKSSVCECYSDLTKIYSAIHISKA